MRLVLFRHGPAGNSAKLALDNDADRPLTAKGRKRTRAAALGLMSFGPAPQRVLSCPYVRALESARIAMRALELDAPLDIHDALMPNAEPAEAMRLVRALADAGDLEEMLLVGHQPHLSALAAHLLGLPGGESLRLRKAGAAVLTLTRLKRPYCATLELLLSADELVRLGQGHG